MPTRRRDWHVWRDEPADEAIAQLRTASWKLRSKVGAAMPRQSMSPVFSSSLVCFSPRIASLFLLRLDRTAEWFGRQYAPARFPEGLLERHCHAPYILRMTLTEKPQTEASDHTAAIARWEDEGDASKSAPAQKGRRRIKKAPASGRMIHNKQKDAHATRPIGRR
jgi:hypothetical protein